MRIGGSNASGALAVAATGPCKFTATVTSSRQGNRSLPLDSGLSIAASGIFPLLQRADLKVCYNYWASTTLLQGAESDAYHPPILPRVQAAGFFRFRVESGYGWPPKRERLTFIGFGM